jgi:DNA-binding transcriptional MerR regulator
VEPVFSSDDVRRLERAHPDGLSAAAVVELLRQRGVLLAEATFRKYVQLGLLPRSRRVGRKGKHRGSHGLYPAACVGRIAEIKSLMEAGLTLEEIQRSATAGLELDSLRRSAEAIFVRLEQELEERPALKTLANQRRLQTLRGQVEQLAIALESTARELCPAVPAAHEVEDPAAVARDAERELRGRRPARATSAGRVGTGRGGPRPVSR